MQIKSLLKTLFLIFTILGGSCIALAQTAKVTGKISDENSKSIPGATIKVPGTTYGTVSDENGVYNLTLPAGSYTIEFSYLGYTTETSKVTLAANETKTINQKMVEESKSINEVVAVGYGTKLKREVTGSQVSLKGKEITDMPAQSFESGIQGKAAGVQVITGSGVAGSGALIRIRGVASLSAGGDPLYVVDGIPITQDYFLLGNGGGFNNNPLASINPNDIEDIQILKDAAATSIYGSRGANGVVLITTKRAKKKGLNFDFTVRLGTATPTVLPQMLNNKEWLQMYQEAWENDGHTGKAVLPNNVTWEQAEQNNTDWIKETMGRGFKQMYSLGTGYKGKKIGIYATFSLDDNGSYVIGNKYNRKSGRINIDYDPIKNLHISFSSSLSKGTNTRVDAAWSGGFGAAMSTALPIFPVYESPGNFLNLGPNPVRIRELKDWKTIENRSINNINVSYIISPRLNVTASSSLDLMNFKEDKFEDKRLLGVSSLNGQTNLFEKVSVNYNYNIVFNYQVFKSVLHDVKMMVGTEYQRFGNSSDNYFATNVTGPGNKIGFDAIKDSATLQNSHRVDATVIDAFNSYFGRFDYSYKKKYYAQVTLRTDGSSRFGPNKRYGFFPAASLGWILSDEAFFHKYKMISFLKLRSGIGYTGNANFASNKWYQAWSTSGSYNGTPILSTSYHKNPNLQWENSRVWDISLEYGLYKGRISGEISFYNKKTSNVLTELSVPPSTGFGTYYGNAGSILNQGFEFSIKSTNLVKGKFAWTTEFNAARNYNKVLDLGIYSQEAISGGTNDTRVVKGAPVGTNYLVRFSHVDPQTGKPVYLDNNGNETYTWNTDYRVNVGSVLPKAVGGLTNDFRYGNWNLNIFFVYKYGGNIYNSSQKRQDGVMNDIGGGYWSRTTESYDRWQKPGDNASLPRLSLVPETYGLSDAWNNNTTRWLYDGSYLRLRNLTLGYNLPKKWLGNKINSFRVAINGTNLLTFSHVVNIDPEIARDFENASDRNMSSNIVWLTAPQEKTFSITLSTTF